MAAKTQKPGDEAEAATPEASAPPVEAPQPAPQSAEADNSITTRVWAAKGQVPKASILQTAIQSVRNAIPVVYELDAKITGAEKKDNDGQPGTEFQVTITYTPRAVEGKTDEVDVDKVIRGLDVPHSFDGIGGVEGDPEFHDRKPSEF